MTKIAQTAVNISFDVGFQDLIVFIRLDCFILWREASRFFLNIKPNEVCRDLFHTKAYLTWEYEHNLFFGCCRDMFHHWEHSLLNNILRDETLCLHII